MHVLLMMPRRIRLVDVQKCHACLKYLKSIHVEVNDHGDEIEDVN